MPVASPAPDGASRRRLWRFNLEVRHDMPPWQQAVYLVVFLGFGFLISGLILVEAGVPAADLFDQLVVSTLTDVDNLRSVLFRAAPLMLIGLSAAIAFRARFWNLGLEGQMIWGGIGATIVSLYGIGPESIRIPIMILFASALAMAWIAIAALLKIRLGVNEIISTLLMNYVALNFLLHLVYGPWRDPHDGFPHSKAFEPFERLGEIGWGLSAALPLALTIAILVWWLVGFTRFGFYLRFVQANDRVAHAVGIPAITVTLGAVLISGALAGIGGFVVVSGQEGRLTQSFFEGYLFSGVLIAFLARNNPLAAVIVSVLVAMLFISGQSLQVFYQVPFSMVQLIEAIVVICVATSEFLIRHRIHVIR
ncbi:ABC transporter permease [Pseudorhodoplanes sinuspersici]|uniref:ABC transporter permease n=2 Tax=Pseudorhodoplanes sinuspersici TaxID=1235591 RepID=A0A1W7A104_9HYPH|nr:ABC transporter permease [Pseudorhodoplanes sinuspersici]